MSRLLYDDETNAGKRRKPQCFDKGSTSSSYNDLSSTLTKKKKCQNLLELSNLQPEN